MYWSDKLQEFQAELYGKLMDYLEKHGNEDDVQYDADEDIIFFKIGNVWINEYEVDIFDVVETLDNLGIECTY